MTGELVKREDRYDLYGEGGSKIASSAINLFGKLSKQNCDEIFGVVDVEKLIKEADTSHLSNWTSDSHEMMFDEGFKMGFNKAMELNKDKVFTLEDMKQALFDLADTMFNNCQNGISEDDCLKYQNIIFQSLQQPTEIEVEIEMWLHHGGEATKNAYENKVCYHDFDIEAHKQFFENQLNYYIDDKNRVFVHGGYLSEDGCGKDPESSEIYYWDRSLFSIALSGQTRNGSLGEKLPRRLRPHAEIYIGHTATVNWNYSTALPAPDGVLKGSPITTPIHACNVWNLDTGGGFKGKVTIMDIDSKKYWQSDFVNTLYPNEAGR